MPTIIGIVLFAIVIFGLPWLINNWPSKCTKCLGFVWIKDRLLLQYDHGVFRSDHKLHTKCYDGDLVLNGGRMNARIKLTPEQENILSVIFNSSYKTMTCLELLARLDESRDHSHSMQSLGKSIKLLENNRLITVEQDDTIVFTTVTINDTGITYCQRI